jgi:hypothetical protein
VGAVVLVVIAWIEVEASLVEGNDMLVVGQNEEDFLSADVLGVGGVNLDDQE